MFSCLRRISRVRLSRQIKSSKTGFLLLVTRGSKNAPKTVTVSFSVSPVKKMALLSSKLAQIQ